MLMLLMSLYSIINLTTHVQGEVIVLILCVRVSDCLSVYPFVTTLAGITGTRPAELRHMYLQKALDVGNKINVGFLAENV